MPTLISGPVDVNVSQNQQILLPCTGAGAPVPFISWYKQEESEDTETLLQHIGILLHDVM